MKVAGALALSGASIVDAHIFTTQDGMALDVLGFQDADSRSAIDDETRLERITRNIERALGGEIWLDKALKGRRWLPSRTDVFRVEPRVLVDNNASRTHSVIEVNGRDRPGLLFDVARTLKDLGLVLLYTLMVLPIVIWIMRDQFDTIPIELEQAAYVDGCSLWGAFLRIIVPLALPGAVAAFILSVILCWNEYFFAALLTSTNAKTLPVMVASQTGSQGINWWSMAALSTAAIAPLAIIGVVLERYIVRGLTAGAVK